MVQNSKSATGMKKLEQEEASLIESKRYFNAIFQQSFQLLALLKPEGTVIDVNQAVLDFSGLDKSKLINHRFWECGIWATSNQTQELLSCAIARAAKKEVTSDRQSLRMD
ncbi:PAS domain S-box protein [Chlorogloeopsis fritschii]|uniref:PAS domain S-box protein n=1 Tax=Chlorogloeopsis fritschii TaxID=1124 RepID=UPI0023F0423A|nr:PAS domain S-box protein [Chlorogloeopsis fritschii]